MSLRLTGITHRYGHQPPVLRGLTLEVAGGEAVAIVGPSGSGKTTLLNILGGLMRPTAGEVLIDGTALARSNKRFTWVFQGSNLLSSRSAVDNVALALYGRGYDRQSALRQAAAWLERVGLAGKEDMTTAQLSGGEAQRVGLARALAPVPRYVIADEPTGQLDQVNSDLVGALLLGERATETSIVIATHDPSLAAMCDRRLLLRGGVLEAAA